jgi:hypothetical protein
MHTGIFFNMCLYMGQAVLTRMRVAYLLLVELPEGDAAGHEDGGSLRHTKHCAAVSIQSHEPDI